MGNKTDHRPFILADKRYNEIWWQGPEVKISNNWSNLLR